MASQFQSRLIGTIILVSIGIIILPDIFDGKKARYQESFATIPLQPKIKEEVAGVQVLSPKQADIALPDSPVTIEVADSSDVTKNTAYLPTNNVTVTPKVISEKNKYQSNAWIIQLVALKNKNNADTLVEDLRKRGFQAHLRPDGKLTRVIVGPNVSKTKLNTQIKELEKITGLNGQLQVFKPLNP